MPLTILPGIIQFARSPLLADLHRAEDRQVDLAAADHREAVVRAEDRRAGDRRDGLLAGVDQVGVDLVLGRERADAEHAVLALQPDLDARRHVVGDQRRQADAEVHVEAVLQFARGARRHFVACPGHWVSFRSLRIRRVSGGLFGHGALLDALFRVRVQHDALHVDAGQVDGVGVELPTSTISSTSTIVILPAIAHRRVEVARGAAEDQVARLVGLPGLDERDVGHQRALHHVDVAVELARLLALGDHRADAGAREEGRDAGAAGAQLLGQRALRRELELELAGQVLALELLVLADVARDHLPDLARLAAAGRGRSRRRRRCSRSPSGP